MRTCEVCGKEMQEGYYVENFEYFCSDDCLHTKYSKEEYETMYDENMAFYTTWEEDDIID